MTVGADKFQELVTQQKKVLKAKYKIEIEISPSKTQGQILGKLHMILNGDDASGDKDQPVFRCPQPECRALILPQHTSGGVFSCPKCHIAGDAAYTSDGAMFRATYEKVAELLEDYWHALGCDAHIFLRRSKYPVHDWVTAYQEGRYLEAERKKKLYRETKEWVIYPLDNLMKDNLSGADMRKRFLAFLRA